MTRLPPDAAALRRHALRYPESLWIDEGYRAIAPKRLVARARRSKRSSRG